MSSRCEKVSLETIRRLARAFNVDVEIRLFDGIGFDRFCEEHLKTLREKLVRCKRNARTFRRLRGGRNRRSIRKLKFDHRWNERLATQKRAKRLQTLATLAKRIRKAKKLPEKSREVAQEIDKEASNGLKMIAQPNAETTKLAQSQQNEVQIDESQNVAQSKAKPTEAALFAKENKEANSAAKLTKLRIELDKAAIMGYETIAQPSVKIRNVAQTENGFSQMMTKSVGTDKNGEMQIFAIRNCVEVEAAKRQMVTTDFCKRNREANDDNVKVADDHKKTFQPVQQSKDDNIKVADEPKKTFEPDQQSKDDDNIKVADEPKKTFEPNQQSKDDDNIKVADEPKKTFEPNQQSKDDNIKVTDNPKKTFEPIQQSKDDGNVKVAEDHKKTFEPDQQSKEVVSSIVRPEPKHCITCGSIRTALVNIFSTFEGSFFKLCA